MFTRRRFSSAPFFFSSSPRFVLFSFFFFFFATNPSASDSNVVVVDNILTPSKRHLRDQFVKYDDESGKLYVLEDLEVEKRYELRVSYSAKTPGKVSVVLVEGESTLGLGLGRFRSRKLLDVEKIAFKVTNDDKNGREDSSRSSSDKEATHLFFSSSTSSSSVDDTVAATTKRRAYARVSVDSSNVVPTNGYKQFPHEGVTFNLTLEECYFFGLIPIPSIPAILLCVAMVVFGLLIGKPFAAFLWREDFTLSKALSSSSSSSSKRRLKKK